MLPFVLNLAAAQPLVFTCDGITLINSTDAKVDVTVDCSINANKGAVNISIPALNFSNTRDYLPQDGVFIKYEFTERGLALGQQTTPF